ncbi:ribonuclease III domain-containing protein [Lactifluus volemus]|nr:ribonuclease III domain-containing protein [Lactifluus volemus]
MMFYGGHIAISLLPKRTSLPDLFRLELRCGGVDWQVSSMAQICDQCSFLLSGIKQLDIRGHMDLEESALQVDMDNTQWLELFHQFAAVQTLRISPEFRSFIVSALQGLSRESVSEVLPALDNLHLGQYYVSQSRQDIEPFITARQRSGRPVSVHFWEVSNANGRSELLPPLPTIHSRRILQRIFTHRSLSKRPRAFEDSPNDPSPDNEQLVSLGGQVFGLVVTDLIRALFPNLTVGPSSKLRDRLKCLATLANIAVLYGLPQHLLVQTDEVRRSPRAQAGVFMAYVGGLYREQGIEVVNSWLFSLFKLSIHREYDHIRKEYLLA